MNFKRFHESKNLFDKDNFTFGTDTTIVYVPIYVGEGMFTLSTDFPEHNTKDVFLIAGNVSSGASSSSNGVSVTTPRTRTAIDGYVTIATRYNNRENPANYNYMLNTGSTALPYEPYSSEVWHDIPHYIHNTSTDTLTTLPAVLYPNDTAATVGLKGDMSQSSTPSPSSPVMPQECGERTGNLFDYSAITTGYRIQWTSGNPYADDTAIVSDYIPVTEGDYALSMGVIIIGYASDKSYIGVYRLEKTWEKRSSDIVSTFTISSSSDVKFVRLMTYAAYEPITNTLMLNSGSTPLPYEPYGIKIPILNNSQTTNVYLGEVQSTRRIKKLVLTGEENFVNQTVSGIILVSLTRPVDMPQYTSGIISSHFVKSSPASNVGEFYVGGSYINFNYDGINDVTTFKTYLQQQYSNGTPVCVWYVLATPTTGIVNEPLRKIGDYADTVSGITIPTIAGANTLSIGTTLQPSEVSVNYHGWHPVADVHERENGAWT